MPVIELVDYGGGNLGSIRRCLTRSGIPFRLTSADEPPTGNYPVILPGVGAFGALMDNLDARGLRDRLVQLIDGGTPYLGICVGLQVLFEGSDESPNHKGLGVLPGRVVKFQGPKVPQIGWNQINLAQRENPSWPNEGYVYFVNSYVAAPADPSVVLYQADYFGSFCAAVQRDNVTAFQFHPEKSGPFGHELVMRWVEQVTGYAV